MTRMNPSLVSHGFATLPPLPGCAPTPLLRPRPRQTAAWWRAVNSQPKITRIKSPLSSLRVQKIRWVNIYCNISFLPFKYTIQHHWSRFETDIATRLWVDPSEAPAAVLASAVAVQTWRRHRSDRKPRCGAVAVKGDFLNALDQEDGMSYQHIAALLDTNMISSTYSEKLPHECWYAGLASRQFKMTCDLWWLFGMWFAQLAKFDAKVKWPVGKYFGHFHAWSDLELVNRAATAD